MTRTARASKIAARSGQGRPLGLMAAWCALAETLALASAEEHRSPLVLIQAQDIDARRLGRECLKDRIGYAALAAFERGLVDGEGSEPEVSP
jgi:hypothetical protein